MTSPLGAMVPIPERVGPWHVPLREFDNGALQSYIQDSAPRSRATGRHRLSVAEGRPRATSRAHRLCASEDTMGSAPAVQRQPRPSRTRRMHRLASPDLHHHHRPNSPSPRSRPTRTKSPSLETALPSSITRATIGSFQGRDSDVVVFATARRNATRDMYRVHGRSRGGCTSCGHAPSWAIGQRGRRGMCMRRGRGRVEGCSRGFSFQRRRLW